MHPESAIRRKTRRTDMEERDDMGVGREIGACVEMLQSRLREDGVVTARPASSRGCSLGTMGSSFSSESNESEQSEEKGLG